MVMPTGLDLFRGEYDWWMHAISRPYCLIAATCPARMQSWLQNGLFSPRKVGFAAIV
jgi:hypothetical protein